MTIITIVSGCVVAVKHGVVTANINSLADYYRIAASDYRVAIDLPDQPGLCQDIREANASDNRAVRGLPMIRNPRF